MTKKGDSMKKLFFIAFVCIIMFGCSQKVEKMNEQTTHDNTGTHKYTDEKTTIPTENSEIDINTSNDDELLNDSEIEIDTSDEELLNQELDVNLDSLDDW